MHVVNETVLREDAASWQLSRARRRQNLTPARQRFARRLDTHHLLAKDRGDEHARKHDARDARGLDDALLSGTVYPTWRTHTCGACVPTSLQALNQERRTENPTIGSRTTDAWNCRRQVGPRR
jgi:hypothetical protein